MGAPNFRFNYLRHFSFNIENSCAHGGFGRTCQRKGLCVGDVVGLRLDHGNVDVDDPIWDLMRRRGCHGPLPGCSYCLVCWAQSTGRVNSCLVVVIVVQT